MPTLDVPFTIVAVNHSSSVSLSRQVYGSLRDAILSGQLSGGVRLPSTRRMASELGISRNTVLSAFEQLHAEGYVEARTGAGTYVVDALPDDMLAAQKGGIPEPRPSGRDSKLSAQGAFFASIRPSTASEPLPRAFQAGLPALDHFPTRVWKRLVAKRWRRMNSNLLGYGLPGGYKPLREAIAAHLGATRGVRCQADQVLVTAGTQQALNLASRILVDRGESAWIEDPAYPGARNALRAAGVDLVPVPVDQEGLSVDAAVSQGLSARLVYVTPSHQFPMGVTMGAARRLALLDWADRAGAWILEDDYDSEFRYVGKPLAALQGLDTHGRVIYLGTFSKVLFPSLRLGFMIVPCNLVDAFIAAQLIGNGLVPVFDQTVLADFFYEGEFERHIRRMRAVYAERQAALVEAAAEILGERLRVQPSPAGMHVLGWLEDGTDDCAVAATATKYRIQALPLSRLRLKPVVGAPALVLGYAAVSPTEIREATRRLARAVAEAQAGPTP